MSAYMTGELLLFARAFWNGALLLLIYDVIRILRGVVSHGKILTAAEDLLFWPGAAVYVFVQIHHTTNGSIRWYFILGVVLGSAFFSFVSKIPKKLLEKLYGKRKRNSSKTVEERGEKSYDK